jgi:hypothetical protein
LSGLVWSPSASAASLTPAAAGVYEFGFQHHG